jgi:hypothetical protein
MADTLLRMIPSKLAVLGDIDGPRLSHKVAPHLHSSRPGLNQRKLRLQCKHAEVQALM